MWLSALYSSPSVPSGWRGLAIGLFVVDILCGLVDFFAGR